MNYDGLQALYWEAQQERVEKLRAKIASSTYLGPGRRVPEDDSLAIGDGRRLNMAVMFVDICNFSSRGMETLEEQETTLKVLNLFFSELIKIAEDYGGNVEKNTGDGLMIYFNDGDGNPSEAGPKRAVSCALTMFSATEYLINPILSASSIETINFRVSIDYGTVTIARLGSPRRFNANTAIGATANFASKMMKHAGSNEIVIGAAARARLPSDWQTHCTVLAMTDTGWTHRPSGAPYPLYKFVSRWARLI